MSKAIEGRLKEAEQRLRAAKASNGKTPARSTSVPGGGVDTPAVGGVPLLSLQRSAGNAAVAALLAGKKRASDQKPLAEIEDALHEIKKNDPSIDKVERGLRATKDTGVAVDLEGEAQKPPPSALQVVKTGFGPSAVPPKPPVTTPSTLPAKSPLAKVVKAPLKPKGGSKLGAGGKGKGNRGVRQRDGVGGGGSLGSSPALAAGAGAALGGDKALAPPVKPVPISPADDPGFTAVTGRVGGHAKAKKSHPPPASQAKEAQDAAVAPPGDVDSQAKAAKVDTMAAQQPGTFDKKAFIAAVKSATEAKTPRTLKEADDYKESGKAAEVKGEVKGLVSKGKDESEKDIEAATEAPPDTSKAVPKQATPMTSQDPGRPSKVDPSAAVPKPAPPEQTNLAYGKHEVGKEMQEEQVTDQQLEKSQEGEFTQALVAKKEAAAHADSAPNEFRQQEATVLQQTKTQVDATTAEGLSGMHASKATALSNVMGGKTKAKSKDEQKRAQVTAKIQSIYAATEADVKKTLDGLDPKVDKTFEAGEKGARDKFEGLVAAKMSAYKRDRYGGWLGGLRWAKDKLLGMPSKVNEFFEAGRELYLKEMDKVISKVADIVGSDLNAAKARIARGRQEIADYVKSLPADLKKVGQEAADDIGEKFAQLESDVDSKQESLVDALATKYVEARKGLDERIEELQAENRGLVDKAVGAVKKVIATIKKLKDLFFGVLARAASVFTKILDDPVGFIGKFMSAVKQGFLNFSANILQHLKKGLLGWLFGALASAGIELPDSFDLKGILKLVASLLGLTWASIKRRLTKLVPARVMDFLESKVEVFVILATEGVGGIWKWIADKVGDLKAMILDPIKEFVIEKVVKAGITWVLGLLNPAGALVKIVQALVSVVQWIVERGAQLVDFVNTVIDGVVDIARGGAASVPAKIENALSKAVPLVISFLASLLGLGGISDKVKSVIKAVQKPISKAIDWVVDKALRGIRKLRSQKKGNEKSTDVKKQAKDQLVETLGPSPTDKQADAAANSVLGRLRPKGLRNLRLGPVTADGTRKMLATASPEDPILKFAPPKRTVKMVVTLTVKGQALPLEGVTPQPGRHWFRDEKGKLVEEALHAPLPPTTTEGKGGKARTRSGGVLAPTEAGSDKVKVATWNTGELDPAVRSNASHAEPQFIQWILKPENRTSLLPRVTEIAITMHKWSPCAACASDLNRVKRLAAEGVKATLSYEEKYPGSDGLPALEAGGWKVTHPATADGKVLELKK